jgi:Cu2+-containing amine oxidase
VTKQMYNRLNSGNELISVSTKRIIDMAHPSIRSMILAAVIGLTALSTADAHPLDGLSPGGISAVVEILRAEGKVTADARYPLIELKEPDKSTVLAWKQGDPEPRVATVNVKAADGVYKGEVDLTAHRVLAWTPCDPTCARHPASYSRRIIFDSPCQTKCWVTNGLIK